MIFERCNAQQYIRPISGVMHRLVESQEHVATRSYVDTLEEQMLLEDLLEASKPRYPEHHNEALHYLLSTPFRYPPLPWGSRFGGTHEPSLCYGGSDVNVTLVESAYYRCVFWASMDASPIKRSILTQHTLFSVGYHTSHGVQLQCSPFDDERQALTDPADYRACQALGSALRHAEVAAIEYPSARDPQHGVCVGLFNDSPFVRHVPDSQSQWLCEVSSDAVSFKQHGVSEVTRIAYDAFLVDGRFPMPA